MAAYILVSCPCGRQVRAREKQIGSKVRCWNCGSEVLVPMPRTGGRIAGEFGRAFRDACGLDAIGKTLAAAIVLTGVLCIPRAGGVLGLLLLLAAGWKYVGTLREAGPSATGRDGRDETNPPARLSRLLWAVVGIVALALPILARNGWHALPTHSTSTRWLALTALVVGWLVVPVLLILGNARDRIGPIPARQTFGALARHPFATLSALLVFPVGLCVLELVTALYVAQQGQMSLMATAQFPTPTTDFSQPGTILIYDYDHAVLRNRLANDRDLGFPIYRMGLRHGYTLVATIPASLTSHEVRTWPDLFGSSEINYLLVRLILSAWILTGCGLLLSIQASWLGVIAAIGSRRVSMEFPRAESDHPPTAPELAPAHQAVASHSPMREPHRSLTEARGGLAPAPAPEPARVERTIAPLPRRAGVHTILIIDDERPFATAIGHVLVSRGFAVLLAEDAAEGLGMARAARPDLIVLDLPLPDRPGQAVCRELRATDLTRSIPIVITTYKGDPADEVACLAEGADDYIVKPYVVDVLIARIQAQLRRSR
jgi:CheY-like chemotaxis protein/DNA-directed RNA polymerase subunit RPC12/RpoP